MSLYSYKVLLEIVNQGSFVKAADELNMSPSAVSHVVSKLEKEYGFSILKRNRGGAFLTENGERILPHVRAIVSSTESLEQEVHKIKNHNVGTVRIGMFSSVASNWFIPILKAFNEKYPNIEIVISQGSYEDIIKWLKTKHVDLAFTTDAIAKGFDFTPLYKDELICLTSDSFVPKNKFSITVKDLKENYLVINKECELYDAREFLEKNKIHPGTYYDIIEHQTLFAMVRERMGICIVPELVAVSAPPSLKKYPIVGNPGRVIGLSLAEPNFSSPATNLIKNEIISYLKF